MNEVPTVSIVEHYPNGTWNCIASADTMVEAIVEVDRIRADFPISLHAGLLEEATELELDLENGEHVVFYFFIEGHAFQGNCQFDRFDSQGEHIETWNMTRSEGWSLYHSMTS